MFHEYVTGKADTLGSGMRNLYKYTRLYSNAEPVLTEGDVFEILIPLNFEANDDANDANHEANGDANEANHDANMKPIEADPESNETEAVEIYDRILSKISENPHITQGELAEALGVSRSTIQRATEAMKKQGIIERIGGTRGYWKEC